MSNNSIYGIDVSNNDGAVEFNKVVADGVVFVIAKATDGTTIQDAYFNEFYQGCKDNGLKLGAYHFLENTSEPETQAQNFYNTIKDKSLDLILFLDVEKEFDEVANYTVRFLNEFKNLCYLEIGIYSYTSFINQYLTSAQDELKDYKLWEANYTETPWSGSGTTFFNKLVGHQYSESGSVSGVSTNCDLNVFTDDVLAIGVSIASGNWKQDNKGWWFEYANPTNDKFPANAWDYIPKSNSDSTPAWFYFNPSGYMVTGWVNSGNYYYLDSKNGDLKVGWFKDSTGKWFYADENGVMQTGWKQIDGSWYYLQETKDNTHVQGEMRTGWINITGNDYLLDSSGVMYSDCTAYGYSFNSNGVAIKLS